MPGCSGQRHLLLGIVILLLGASVPAQQRSNVVLDNPLEELSDSIQNVAAQVSPAIVQIEILGYIHPDDDKSDDQDRSDDSYSYEDECHSFRRNHGRGRIHRNQRSYG